MKTFCSSLKNEAINSIKSGKQMWMIGLRMCCDIKACSVMLLSEDYWEKIKGNYSVPDDLMGSGLHEEMKRNAEEKILKRRG